MFGGWQSIRFFLAFELGLPWGKAMYHGNPGAMAQVTDQAVQADSLAKTGGLL